jgi:molecular chaperone DnaK
MTDTIIGIDLGTTNSEVAVFDQGKVTIIADNGNKILPSVVGITEDDIILVGEEAKNQSLLYPERTLKSVKRLMGQEITLQLAEQSYTPQEISAIILKRLKMTAQRYLNKLVSKAVITVPAYFSDAQRQATRAAGEIAGLKVVRIINEPTAAALAYGASHQQHKNLLVYDLGGGTFDVSVVNVESDIIEVLSSHGNNHLGGDDFNNLIIQHILAHIQNQQQLDLSTNATVMARISRAAEAAKIKLSTEPYVQIAEEYLYLHQGTPVHLTLELSRLEYESMIETYISETLDAVHIALKDANLTTSDIDEILLVGGATRTPCIRERLFSLFGFEPHGEVDADLCVALGAATQAAIMAGETVSSVLVDVTPYSYGTSALGMLAGEEYPYVFYPVIRKNSPLPVSKTEAFETLYDNQEVVDISVFQGEDADALKNTEIGHFRVTGLQKLPSGNIITVKLALDLDGILHISAKEKSSGLEKSITIDHALAKMEAAEINSAKYRLDKLFHKAANTAEENHRSAEQNTPETEAARHLISKAEALFAQISAEDKQEIQAVIKQIELCLEKQDFTALGDYIEKLNDILFYLES